MKRKKIISQKTGNSKKYSRFPFTSKGSITFKILILVVIVGSISLVRGLFPSNQITPQDPNSPRYKPIDDNTVTKDSLQLKTLKFQKCSSMTAVELLVDVSGSMKYVDNAKGTSKLDELKKALKLFSSKMTDDSIIGLHSYSIQFRENVPISVFKDVKGIFNAEVDKLAWQEATHTRTAFEQVKIKLEQAIAKYPGRQFVLIFASDGIPESQVTSSYCFRNLNDAQCKNNCQDHGKQTQRCFAPDQDPTQTPNIANEIKNMGVKIYSIAILDTQDSRFNNQLTSLLQNVASPNSFYTAPSSDELSNIYNQIGFETCEQAG